MVSREITVASRGGNYYKHIQIPVNNIQECVPMYKFLGLFLVWQVSIITVIAIVCTDVGRVYWTRTAVLPLAVQFTDQIPQNRPARL